MDPTDSPSISEAFRVAVERELLRLMGPMPGEVLDYDADTQMAIVQPLVKRMKRTEQGNTRETLPPVQRVPIMFPGSGEWRDTWPVSVGDTVLLIPAGCSLDRWISRGGLVDPEDDRHHELTDSVAIPGLFDLDHVPTAAPTDSRVLHGPLTRVGTTSANDPVVRKSDLDLVVAKLNAHISAYNTHIHPAGTPSTGVPASLDSTMSAPPGSTYLKVP